MNYNYINYLALLVVFELVLLFPHKSAAQTIPVGDIREELLRVDQLLSDSLSNIDLTFSNRSLSYNSYKSFYGQNSKTSLISSPFFYKEKVIYPGLTFGLYDGEFKNTFNSELPYSENNGAAWYGRGSNIEVMSGFYLTSRFITLSLRPQFVWHQNRDFPVPRFVPEYPDGSIRYVEPGVLPEDSLAERIDRPFRYGPDPFVQLDPGHSSIRFHYNQFELGLSSEPIWWGPGIKYGLLMSNNSAGVPRLFTGTRNPVKLPYEIGKLEFNWFIGQPKDSDYFDLDPESSPNRINQYERSMLLGNRIMHGLNLTYSPSFIDNFHVGFARVLHQYKKESCKIEQPTWDLNCDAVVVPSQKNRDFDLFAIFKPFPQTDTENYTGIYDETHYQNENGITSIFFRWIWIESNAEIYGEFLKDQRSFNFRDLLTQPQNARAYTFGFRKLYDTKSLGVLSFHLEFNSTLPALIDDVRPQSYIYTHKNIKQGHTHRGQILGAAIGPGSTSQYLSIDSYLGKSKIGFFVQRMVDNDQFHYEYHQRYFPEGGYKDQFRHQVKLNSGMRGFYRLQKLLLQGSLTFNKHFEYGRYNYGVLPISWDGREREDVINWQFQFGVRYLF